MYFDLGRSEGFPTQYGANRTPVTIDVLEVGLIVAAVILTFSFYISIISSRISENICVYTRVTISMLIGILLLLGNYGQEWEVAHIKSKTPYKAGSGAEIHADIGVKIGLRSVNITLKSDVNEIGPLKHEMIDYNERFEWTWDQGRFGFGPYSGHFQQQFRAAQYRGLPTPILWIADYFVIDGEGFRHGRFYRTAGWYTHIALWSAFPCWILANILFRSVIKYGGYCIGLCGGFQLLATLLWSVIKNPHPLVIPFEDDIIRTRYGANFWLTFFNGILCLTIFIVVMICESRFNLPLYNFFNVSVITNSDETYLTYDELTSRYDQTMPRSNDHEMLIMREPGGPGDSANTSFVMRVRKNTHSIIKPPIPVRTTTDWDNVRKSMHLVPHKRTRHNAPLPPPPRNN